MDTALLKKLIRQGLLILGGTLVSQGQVSSDQVDTVAGALAILVSTGWMIYTHRRETAAQAAAGKGPQS